LNLRLNDLGARAEECIQNARIEMAAAALLENLKALSSSNAGL